MIRNCLLFIISFLTTVTICAQDSLDYNLSCKGFVIDTAFIRARSFENRQGIPCNFSGTFVMPVVIHVIHNGEPIGTGFNVSEADILNQLEITNEHFRHIGVDPNLYPNDAADIQIEFQLARSDENGMPHTGISRTHWTASSPPYSRDYINTIIKPSTIWNPDLYLNIWITQPTDENGTIIGGYAMFPTNTGLGGESFMQQLAGTDQNDGVVINYNTVNNLLSASSLTHEIGHYLGLFHTWGNGTESVGDASHCYNLYQDYCDDTPATRGHYFTDPNDCNDYITCGFTRDMTENFMDYSIPCHQIFTNDQKYRMQQSLYSPRRPTHIPSNTYEWLGLDTYEPNNSTTSSSNTFPILNTNSINTSINSYIFQNDDQDWYKLNIQGPGTLTIGLLNLPDNYDLELYGPDGLSGWIDGSYSSGTSSESIQFSYASQVSTTLYIKIYGFSDGSSFARDRCNTYELNVQWAPTSICTPVNFVIANTNESSSGANDGSASITTNSGVSPFTYLWSNGNINSNISNLGAGTYTVTVTGSDGCSSAQSVYIGVQGQPQPYCVGTTQLTSSSGSFNDGSGGNNYVDNSVCNWLIDPTINNASVTLEFTSFNLDNSDAVNVYDGNNNAAPLIGSYTGSSLPPILTSSGPTMYVSFISDQTNVASGWTANYYSQILSTGVSLVQYEYWFDNDYSNRTVNGISPQAQFHLNTDLPTPTNLTHGLHSFHIRFKDDRGYWSSVLSQLVYKMNLVPSQNNNDLIAYEYWFDNDYNGTVQYNGITPQTQYILFTDLDLSNFTHGLHSLHIRFKDRAQQWSSVLSQLVYKTGNSANPINQIDAYRYWFDSDYANITVQNLTPPAEQYVLSDLIDASYLSQGEHRVHFQFKDAAEQWSSVLTDTFEVLPIIVSNFLPDTGSISMFPNPCMRDTKLQIIINEINSNKLSLFIYDNLGKLMKKENYSDILPDREYKLLVNLEGLNSGNYHLFISAGNKGYSGSLIVLDN